MQKKKEKSQDMQIANHILVYRSCSAGCLDGSLIKQKVLLCDKNNIADLVKAAGALGCIIPNQGHNYSDVGPLPVAALGTNDMNLVKTYQNSTKYEFASSIKSQLFI